MLQQETVIRDLKWFRFSTVSKSQSLQSLSYVGLQRGWHARLGDDDQSAAVWVALLGFPDTSKGEPARCRREYHEAGSAAAPWT